MQKREAAVIGTLAVPNQNSGVIGGKPTWARCWRAVDLPTQVTPDKMKRAIIATVMSVASAAAFAQGTVNFLNDTVTLSSPPDRLIRFAFVYPPFPPGSPAFGTNFQVQL